MKALLILPANDHLRVTKLGAKPKGQKFFRFSMRSLLYVAACTPDDVELKILDEHIEAIDFNEKVDLVGITFMTGLSKRAYEIADRFRKAGVKVVLGGYHASFFQQEALEHADAVCIGEAEVTWPRLIDDLKRGELQSVYRADVRADLSKLKLPRRDLLKRNYYAPIEAVQVGRGCNHKCDFCSVTAFFKNSHCVRPVKDVIHELSMIKSKRIIFVDDNIIANPEYAKELFRAMIPLKKKWISQAGLYIADDLELVELASASGCTGLFVGLESLNEANLEHMQKGFNVIEKYEKNIKVLHQHGIGVEAGIVFGFDNDDKKVFEKTLDFLLRHEVEAVQVSILTPLPGTPFYESMSKAQRIVDTDWAHYDYRHATMLPRSMRRVELQSGADWVISRFYSPWNILRRVVRSVRYLGIEKAFTFCLGLNCAYLLDARQCRIQGANPAHATSESAEVTGILLSCLRRIGNAFVFNFNIKQPG